MSRAYCTAGDHYPEEIIATAFFGTEDRIDVIQDNEGIGTNRFVDGTIGVPDNVREEAELDEEPVCLEHPDCFITWDHS